MRKTKSIKINGKDYVLKELTTKDVFEIGANDNENVNLLERVDDFLGRCSDIPKEVFYDLAPSEILEVWEEFREVNAAFFKIAGWLGLGEVVNRIKANLQMQFAELLTQDMVQ